MVKSENYITMKKIFVLTLLSFLATAVIAQQLAIIPTPQTVKQLSADEFELKPDTRILYDKASEQEAYYLAAYLNRSKKNMLEVSDLMEKKAKKGDIVLLCDGDHQNDEAYKLVVEKGVVWISGLTSTGIFYGVQSLLQLFPPQVYSLLSEQSESWKIPAVEIVDAPVFQWRGMHLDVCRHFFPADYIKKFIDLLAYHKFNTFHWHLTEDQGWRIEIKKYPKLTEVGAWRDSTMIGHWKQTPRTFDKTRYGGFYTQKEIKEIVRYAQMRHITIVPEIEMPGHAQAAVTAYPEYGCTGKAPGVRPMWAISEHIYNPEMKTIEFLKDVLDEVMALFPGEYIHIGGDEALKKQWEESERIQQLLKERGLKDMHEMQSWFIKQMDDYLTSKGRKLIGWDEILEGGLAQGAAVMSWRGEKGGIAAAKMGHKVVMTSNEYTYFDHYQSKDEENEPLAIRGFLPLERVFNFNPIPKDLNEKESKLIMGAQAQLWTEYIATQEKLEYMAMPRMCALSDVVWGNREERNYDDFLKSLKHHLMRLDKMEVNYRVPDELR